MKNYLSKVTSVFLALSVLFCSTITFSFSASAVDENDSAEPISIGDTKSVTVGASSRIKYFSFTPEKDVAIRFSSVGKYDTFASLYDANMEEIASNDDSEDRNFELIYSLTAGQKYYLSCKLFNESLRGTFDVKLENASLANAKSLSKCNVKLASATYTYTGEEITPDVTVKDGVNILVKDTDYIVSYDFNTNIGTAEVTVTGIGNYKDSVKKEFTITQKNINDCTVTLDSASVTYDGSQKTPAVTVKNGSKVLSQNIDYTLTYSNNTNVGTASVTVTGAGNFFGTVAKSFTISPKSISGCTVTVDPDSFTYDGTAKTPSVTVKDGDTSLTKDTDYTVSYSNNTNAGTASVTVTGTGNYGGSVVKTFAVLSKSISACNISLETESYNYDGTAKTPAVTVKDGSTTLTENTHYRVTYSNNTGVGTASAVITGIGNYAGSVTKTFQIVDKVINNCTVTLSASSYTYDGTAKTPDVTVKNGTITLTKDTDYTVTYSNNVNAGTASVLISAKGEYTGSYTKTFTITAKSISDFSITLGTTSYTYDGTAKTPSVTVKNGSLTLTKDTDYTVSYSNNTNAGTASAVITGKGNYTSSVSKTFTINAKSLSSCTVSLGTTSYTYDGSAKTPTVTVTDGSTTLTKNTHYTVSYSNNTNVGTASAVISGTGNYTGSVTKTFTISKRSMSDCTVTLGTTSYSYDGSAKTPSVTVTYNGRTFTKDTDYTVSYSNNTSIGTASAVITGKGNFTGSVTKSFTITARSISNCTITLSSTSYDFDGTAKTPTVTVKDGTTTLTKDTHYTLSYSNNTYAGTASVVVAGKGNYSGSVTKTFTISCDTLSIGSSRTVTISTGGQKKYYKFVPSSSMKIMFYSTGSLDTKAFLYNSSMSQLASDDDSGDGNNFKVTYSVTSGTTYYLSCNIYNSSTTGSFTVYLQKYTKSISECTISLSPTSYTYDGSYKYPTVTVKDGSTTLTKNTDYTVSYSNNYSIGTAYVYIYGSGSYTGSVTKTFTITAKSITSCTITLSQTSYTYDGTAKCPTVTVKDGSTTLTKNTHYTVSYSNNVNAGTATVYIYGTGTYSGTATKTFTISAPVTYNIGLSNLTFSFSNNQDAFGYPSGYRIPVERFIHVFGDNARARDYFNREGVWGGSCFGMSAAASMMNVPNSGIAPQDFGVNIVWDVNVFTWSNSIGGMSCRDAIECLHIMPRGKVGEPSYGAYYVKNSNSSTRLNNVRDTVANMKYTGKPVVLYIAGLCDGQNSAHAVVGYRVDKVSSSETRIYVYDPNYPNSTEWITLGTDSNNNVTSWSYLLNHTYSWGTGKGNDWIGYYSFDTIKSVWYGADRTATYPSSAASSAASSTLTVSAKDFALYDADNTKVASVNNGNLTTDDPEITQRMLFADEVLNNSNPDVTLFVPSGTYKVVADTNDGLTATMVNVDRSATVKTTSDTVVFTVDDNSRQNEVNVYTTSGDTYSIFSECTEDDQEGEIKVSGVSEGGVISTSLNNGTFTMNNCPNAKVAVNGVEIDESTKTPSTFSMTMPADGIKGDVNFDGTIDINDVTDMQRTLSNGEKLSPKQSYTADLTDDSSVDINDASFLQQYIVGSRPLRSK